MQQGTQQKRNHSFKNRKPFKIGEHHEGTVKAWNSEKGFGFIEAKDRNYIFVHRSKIESDDRDVDLRIGQLVSFTVGAGREQGQIQAEDVSIIA